MKYNEVYVPSSVQEGRLIIRGTKEWDDREDARRQAGNTCLSYGGIMESIFSNGKTSLERYR